MLKVFFSLMLCCIISCTASNKTNKASEQWVYIDNGIIRIGVDKSRGACIGFFGESKTGRNLLNHFDEGRFIQQSYYGTKDGSNWNGKPWVYNPVQGGSFNRTPSKLLKFDFDKKKKILYAKTIPRNWAGKELCPEVIMEETISLKGNIAKISFKMTYSGTDQNKIRDQEMPAVFVDGSLNKFVYFKDGKMVSPEVGILTKNIKKSKTGLRRGHSSTEWVAYLNNKNWGIGIYTPGTSEFVCYRAPGNRETGPDGSACSYVAPVRQFALTQNLVVTYDVYLTIGKLIKIKSVFNEQKKKVQSYGTSL